MTAIVGCYGLVGGRYIKFSIWVPPKSKNFSQSFLDDLFCNVRLISLSPPLSHTHKRRQQLQQLRQQRLRARAEPLPLQQLLLQLRVLRVRRRHTAHRHPRPGLLVLLLLLIGLLLWMLLWLRLGLRRRLAFFVVFVVVFFRLRFRVLLLRWLPPPAAAAALQPRQLSQLPVRLALQQPRPGKLQYRWEKRRIFFFLV